MTRPAGRVRRHFNPPPGRIGSGQQVLKISRVELSRVRSFPNITGRAGSGRVGSGRVGSGKEVFKYLGSGRVTPDTIRLATSNPTREKPWIQLRGLVRQIYLVKKCPYRSTRLKHTHTSDELKTCLLTQFLNKTARNCRQHSTTSPGLLSLPRLSTFSATASTFATTSAAPKATPVTAAAAAAVVVAAAAPVAVAAFCWLMGCIRRRDGSWCIAFSKASSIRSRTSHLS